MHSGFKSFELMEFNSIIVRLSGEIGIKGDWTRRAYERRLLKNIVDALSHYDVPYEKIVRKCGRIYLKTHSAMEASLKLARVFGISSLSPALETTSKLNDIVEGSLSLATQTLQRGNTFAVRCRRVGHHPYTSADVCREVGRQILTAFPHLDLKVNLRSPDVSLGIEVRDESAFAFTKILGGTGGFPLGTQPRVVCLLSGGIDSPVASWLAMKRGCPITPIYFDNSPFTDDATTERALNVAKVLFEWAIGFPRKVYVVPHGGLMEIVEGGPKRLTCILCKRMMYRIAERIADMERAEGIVTGESIGEQASQTLRNLRVLSEAATRYPIHRPLLGLDKMEIEKMARKIETYQVSIQKAKACTAAPSKPATQAKIEEVRKAEEDLHVEGMVKSSLEGLRMVRL